MHDTNEQNETTEITTILMVFREQHQRPRCMRQGNDSTVSYDEKLSFHAPFRAVRQIIFVLSIVGDGETGKNMASVSRWPVTLHQARRGFCGPLPA
jgi:hypothetical protein